MRNDAAQVEIKALSAATNVSTLTVLLDWFDVSGFGLVIATIQNLDGANNVTLIVDVSRGGSSKNTGRQQTALVAAGDEGDIEVSIPNPRKYIRVSAQTDSPGFPTVSVKWALDGLHR